MSEPDSTPLAQEIDRVLDRVEGIWKAGGRPDIDDFMSLLPQPARAKLLTELVLLEVAYRRKAGEAITDQEALRQYRERYAPLLGLDGGAAETLATSAGSIDQYQFLRELGGGGRAGRHTVCTLVP